MDRQKVTNEIIVSQFINTNDKNVKLNSFQELINAGTVTDFCFVYTKPKDKENSKYISTRIIKLDLYNRIITTANGNKFKILNEIEVNTRKKTGE